MTTRESILTLHQTMNEATLGQKHIIDRLIIGLLADGNVLLEGLPGLAKTRVVRSLSECIESKFSRIQFTPDLSASDVMGEERKESEAGKEVFRFHEGAIFGNIILADEINRAPAKVQSAMLEAMEERQVTLRGETHKLPQLFMVLATQNPIEQEGTFPLSEAQKDRFLMHVTVGYIDMESEFMMVKMVQEEKRHTKAPLAKIPQSVIFVAQDEVSQIVVSDDLGHYMIDLVFCTRYPLRYSRQLEVMIAQGVSPRASIALSKCAKAHAWLKGRAAVELEDIHSVIHDVFRHRLTLTEHAIMNARTKDDIVDIILAQVPLPASVKPKEA